MIVHFIIEWTVCRFQHARVLLSAPDAAQDKFPLRPSLSTKRRLELIGLTQIDGVQVLPRLGLLNSTDTWPQEGNTNNTKRPDPSLEAPRPVARKFGESSLEGLRNMAQRKE